MKLKIYSNGETFRVTRKALIFDYFLDYKGRDVPNDISLQEPIEFKTKKLAFDWVRKMYGEEGVKAVEPSPWNQV